MQSGPASYGDRRTTGRGRWARGRAPSSRLPPAISWAGSPGLDLLGYRRCWWTRLSCSAVRKGAVERERQPTAHEPKRSWQMALQSIRVWRDAS